ncbi:MAG: hypothetical protein EOP06_16825 [Proteobacteria bacterium]|nr:MAG: hypothetical protein EOP06_16825 [Pseudomonadota bacterium]
MQSMLEECAICRNKLTGVPALGLDEPKRIALSKVESIACFIGMLVLGSIVFLSGCFILVCGVGIWNTPPNGSSAISVTALLLVMPFFILGTFGTLRCLNLLIVGKKSGG